MSSSVKFVMIKSPSIELNHIFSIVVWLSSTRSPLVTNLATIAPVLEAIPRNHSLIDRSVSLVDDATGQLKVMAWPNTLGIVFTEIHWEFIIIKLLSLKIKYDVLHLPQVILFDQTCISYVQIFLLLTILLIISNFILFCCWWLRFMWFCFV